MLAIFDVMIALLKVYLLLFRCEEITHGSILNSIS